ncbi:hypothetical protein AVDCRST_MAG92-5021 [uncultured Coleofasciculus sp.]|uniref:STICHEL DnaA-N-like alpha-beta domain-containing protein n=1 Tax=uncultured Coleofasciculus sp. TaxID=1267456 RepID=A0A6J4K9X0_9CYAN|nr:hypothetical protein AVDCRST_MAG92-5021 [uncultured Coleofasciculus sp.]
MQSQKFVQLELPVIPQKMGTLKTVENVIQEMLDITWHSVITYIQMPSTKTLMSEHGKLVALDNREARIRVSSIPLYKIAQTKLPEIQAAFQKAFGVQIKVRIEV